MKAHHNYTTTMTTAIRLRWGTATLLALAALLLGIMLLWRTNGQSTLLLSSSDIPVSRAAEPIASCRTCRDEWVAAQAVQPVVAVPAQRPQASGTTTVSRAAGPITSCRACRDEWIAAQKAIIPTGGQIFDQPEEDMRASGPQ